MSSESNKTIACLFSFIYKYDNVSFLFLFLFFFFSFSFFFFLFFFFLIIEESQDALSSFLYDKFLNDKVRTQILQQFKRGTRENVNTSFECATKYRMC